MAESNNIYRSNIQKLVEDVHTALFDKQASRISQNVKVVRQHIVNDIEFVGATSLAPQAPIKCAYILHAMFYVLRGENCKKVLTEMSNRHIQMLKHCINKTRNLPKPNLIEQESRLDTVYQHSHDIVNGVNMDWDVVVAAQSKWANAIDGFKRNTKKRKVAFDSSEATPMADLATQMGLSFTTLYSRLNSYLKKADAAGKAEVESWFVSNNRQGDKSAVRIEFVDQFMALFGGEREKGRPAKTVQKKTGKKTIKNAKSTAAIVPIARPKNVQELRTSDSTMARLSALLAEAQNELGVVKQKYGEVLAQASEPGEGTNTVLEHLVAMNAEVTAAAAKVKQYQDCIDAVKAENSAAMDLRNAEVAHRNAEQAEVAAKKAWNEKHAAMLAMMQQVDVK